MKIIKPGDVKTAKFRKERCEHCGCRFEYDDKTECRYERDRNQDVRIVKCPQRGCGREIFRVVTCLERSGR